MLLFKPGQCNALFHRATQEVICGHKWEAADTGTGWTWTDRQMDVSHRTLGRHQSPSHTTGHFLASKPAFDLEFVIYHHNHGEREEAQQVVSWWGGNIFECGISAVLWRQSAWRDACAKTVALHIKPSRKKKPQTHPANTDRWQGDGRATIATTCWCSYFSPPALSLWFISKRKNMKVIIWTSLFLRQKIYLIP